ncbi:MAG: SsrA-binding protein SmpB [Geminicoccaceae bacterium]
MADKGGGRRIVAQNRRAFHDYHIDERIEAGLVLQGTEVKSLRSGRANIGDAYAAEDHGELWLVNAYIPEYEGGNRFNHETKRARKLLVRRKEMARLFSSVQRKGNTLVPLSIYFTQRGLAKVEIGVARGKKEFDKRAAKRDRDWSREKQRLLKHDA